MPGSSPKSPCTALTLSHCASSTGLPGHSQGSAPHLCIPTSAPLNQGRSGHGCCDPLHAQPRAGPCAVCRLQENQRLIASWEILRVLLGTKSETCSLAAWGWDTVVAPGWWLEPATSQHRHHPSLPGHPPGTATAARASHFGSKRAAPQAGDWRGTKLFESPTGHHWQYPALATGPSSCSSIPAVNHNQDIAQRVTEMVAARTHRHCVHLISLPLFV